MIPTPSIPLQWFTAAVLLVLVSMSAAAQIPAGATLWLKADSGVVAAGGKVSLWSDASGNGNHARQEIVEQMPSLLPNGANGLPAVGFNGANHMVGSSVFPVTSDYTLLFVVRINNLAATNNVVSGNSHAHWFGGNTDAKVLHGNFSAQAISSIPIVQGEFTLVTMSYLESRKRASIFINSHFADSNVVGSNLDSTIYLGAYAQGNFLNGDIAEVFLYRRELSGAERQSSERYLFTKYGIDVPPPPPLPDSTFSDVPKSQQLYAREANDSAVVTISGRIREEGFDSIYVTITRNGQPWKHVAASLVYSNGSAPFNLQPTIHAGLSEYRFRIGIKSAAKDSLLAVRDSVVCGDVFLITGQSNSIFGGTPETHEFIRTFGNNYSPNARDTLWTVARADGYGGGPHIGAWGLRMAKLLMDHAEVPICIINGGVGGTTVEQHQRNDLNPTDLGTIYGSMLYRVRTSGLADKAKGLLWYQGESNSITNYYANFRALYEDWKVDYPNIEKFYVVQIRPGCGAGAHNELRELQRTLPDSLANLESFSVMGVPGHDGCHYLVSGYDTIGTQLYRLVARDFYNATDTVDISSPNLLKAYFTDATNRRIALLFSNAQQGLIVTPDTIVSGVAATIKEAFFLDDTVGAVESVETRLDTVFLRLAAPSNAKRVAYIPSQSYPGTGVVFEGPWVKNMRGVGAFSFHDYPITARPPVVDVPNVPTPGRDLFAVPNPFSTRTELRATFRHAGALQILLHNALGQEVRRTRLDVREGENRIVIERGDLAPGLYLCTFMADGREHQMSIVVQ